MVLLLLIMAFVLVAFVVHGFVPRYLLGVAISTGIALAFVFMICVLGDWARADALWAIAVFLLASIAGAISLIIGLPFAIARHLRRPPPEGHCQKCGYDLTGNLSGRCPECGKRYT